MSGVRSIAVNLEAIMLSTIPRRRLATVYQRNVLNLTILICLVHLLLGCGGGDGDETKHDVNLAGRSLKVVTTTGMINDIVLHVGGGRVQTLALMGAGVDPHLYKASEGDVRRLTEADVIFYNGLHLEAKLAEVLKQMHRRVRTVAVAEAIDPNLLLAPAEFEGQYDPHVWMDVTLWMVAVKRVRDSLIEIDSLHEQIYTANADTYLQQLTDLQNSITMQLAQVPSELRVLVTAHDAFAYFGRAYDIEVRGLQGISTVSEAGTADVQQLASFIAERKIPAIFVESSVPPRAIEAVQAAVKARGHQVTIGGKLFSDALGNPDTPEGSYVGMMHHNVNTIVEALSSQHQTAQ